jgi:imidazole glycerol-phosphate synthase subunit HisF
VIKTRVIPVLLVQDGLLKKKIKFNEARTIANPVTIARVFESRRSDELVLLDIGKTVDKEHLDPDLITQIAEELYMPFAYGGGITSVEEMREVIQSGAEKVVINTAAVSNPNLITDGATKFGRQCIIVSIDAKEREDESYEVYTMGGRIATGLDAVEWAKEAERRGAGEILLNSIDHEGTMKGYNLPLIKKVTDAVSIPVIVLGGVGKIEDVPPAITEAGASAVAVGSLFHYTHVTPDMIKEELQKKCIQVRIQNPEYCR